MLLHDLEVAEVLEAIQPHIVLNDFAGDEVALFSQHLTRGKLAGHTSLALFFLLKGFLYTFFNPVAEIGFGLALIGLDCVSAGLNGFELLSFVVDPRLLPGAHVGLGSLVHDDDLVERVIFLLLADLVVRFKNCVDPLIVLVPEVRHLLVTHLNHVS